MKDLFSSQSSAYRQYRPTYPPKLYDAILQHVQERERVWDCGTGNGQVAAALADEFQEVEATDISENQLINAITKPNVYYKLKPAEESGFEEESFDLITVAQAIHWFDFDAFYREVRRVAKEKAVLAVWGYGLLKIDAAADTIIDEFYTTTLASYWEPERQHIDRAYSTLPFPFQELAVPQSLDITRQWTLQELQGYLSTWSAVQKYKQAKQEDPVPALILQLQPYWQAEEVKEVRFPVFMKLGRIE